jgi:outer membrane protein OmpA-like peptidoglycan-associated protein
MNFQKLRSEVGLGLAFMLMTAGSLPAFAGNPPIPPQGSQTEIQKVPQGQKMKILGIVIKRRDDTFVMRDQTNVLREVLLSPSTDVATHKKGVFRGQKTYGVSYILRGLRLEATGDGNSEGQLVAEKIRFDEDDLRTAQALEARVDPLEEEQRRQAEEQKRQAADLDKNIADTIKAQRSADEAMKSATIANNRINGLDEFDPIKTIVVPFATGSSALGPKGRAEIDAAAAWVKTQNTKGWVVAVVGFADTTGKTEANRRLSERRANAVIGYLVQKHNLPLQRLVQPFGYGENNPVAENTTAAGRAQNRRVEIRLMQNRGIAGTTQ